MSVSTEPAEQTAEQTAVQAPAPAAAPRKAKRPRRRRLAVRLIAVFALLCLLALASFGGLTAYAQYSQVRNQAMGGVAHLKQIQTLLTPYLQHPGIPDAATLTKVETELLAAQGDFAAARADLSVGVFATAGNVPVAQSMVGSGITLTEAAGEGCQAGLDLIHVAQTMQPFLQSSVMGGSSGAAPATSPAGTPTGPTLTAAVMAQVTQQIQDAQAHLVTTIADLQAVQGSSLLAQVATPQQVAQLQAILAQWPHLQSLLAEADAWLAVAPALLGVNGPERFLIELMDRGEMRSTGGYIGDYGVMTIQSGKMQPFSLSDTQTLDQPYEAHAGWFWAPAPYTWWPFPGFALRDSNLSPDYPTSARMAIGFLQKEAGIQAQGAVAFTEPAISRVLAVIGPVVVPQYNITVTAQNLELVIRQQTENPSVLHSPEHEKFTGLLGQAFQAKLHSLPTGEMSAIAQAMLTSLRTKDIQVYFADPQTEALWSQLGFDDRLAHGPGDGLTVIDANYGVSKANAFTTVTYHDAVSLDAQGTATHHLTITYDFDSARHPDIRPYIGPDHYLDYLRVYAPADAQLISYDGFNGNMSQGASIRINQSDQPGRQMWGGPVNIPDGHLYTMHFVWSVPHAATENAAGYWSYPLEVQHQPGSDQVLQLSVTIAGSTHTQQVYSGPLTQDESFVIHD